MSRHEKVARNTCKSSNEEVLDKCLYAMKVGLRKESANTVLRFKRELSVLRELKNAGVFHTPLLFDSGRVCDRYYIVMTLFDKSLEKLKENVKGLLRPSSVYHLAGEGIAAIEEVHAIGYIHRDIKPTNFCIGINMAAARLFLVDFGETVKNGKSIRYGVPDAYSLPYWSIDSHKKVAANPRVDLEAWFYTFIEMLDPQLLSWKKCHVESEVLAAKIKFWDEISECLANCSSQILETAKLILEAPDKVDYGAFKKLMDEAKNAYLKGAPLTLEWVKEMPKSFPKRGDHVAPGADQKSVRSVRTQKSAPLKKKQIPEDVASSDEFKSAAGGIMQRFGFRSRKVRVARPLATAQRDTSSQTSFVSDTDVSSASLSQETRKSEGNLSQEKKDVEERASVRQKRKPKQAAETQEPAQSAEKPPEQAGAQPPPASEGETVAATKPEPSKTDGGSNLFQLLSFRVRKTKKPTAPPPEEKPAVQEAQPSAPKESQVRTGEVDVDPSKQTATAQSESSKSESGTLFQMISRRIRRKKAPAAQTSATADAEQAATAQAQAAATTTSQAADAGSAPAAAKPEEASKSAPASPATRSIFARLRPTKRTSSAAPGATTSSASNVQDSAAVLQPGQIATARSSPVEGEKQRGLFNRLRAKMRRSPTSESAPGSIATTKSDAGTDKTTDSAVSTGSKAADTGEQHSVREAVRKKAKKFWKKFVAKEQSDDESKLSQQSKLSNSDLRDKIKMYRQKQEAEKASKPPGEGGQESKEGNN
ncbi:hypothetical protein Y032_0043g877 [Ancylostoma ceylanicum]|uniref:non-specific serine/threonine protein kinase n=1 Tax=Ancylostoma ceylanicum TaxID=53326 RepID=A0A016UGH4_9BILA|nr:hypothetical protein Y032_0043g877 [Ancylostoma ceylanicum]